MSRIRHRDLPLIGWSEYVDLPEWSVRGLRAKVDTGARTSALHVDRIRELPRNRVRFEVVLHRAKRDRRVGIEAPIRRRARVRSSNGEFSTRVFVTTTLRLGPVEREIEISLVDRGRMIHRMLLGRSALAGEFLIDAAESSLLTSRPRRMRRRKSGDRKPPHHRN